MDEAGRFDSLNLLQRLPANRSGRDFVVGDLHGCLEMLERLLAFVRFDPAQDRLFAAGDIVDRGPDSMGCLRLLEQPWFHAVMGNHEEMMLGHYWDWFHPHSRRPSFCSDEWAGFLLYGGAWVVREETAPGQPSQPFARLLRRVAGLPQVVVVGTGEDRFNIIHAELPEGHIDEMLDQLPPTTSLNDSYPQLRWSRQFMAAGSRSPRRKLPERVDGLSSTFCGHNIEPKVRKIFSHICLDTGAFLACKGEAQYGLTLADACNKRVFTLRSMAGGIEESAL